MGITRENVENVQHVIFGLQKQANVQNAAIVRLLIEKIPNADWSTEESSVNSLKQFVKNAIAKLDITIELLLLVGQQSISNLESGEPCTMSVDQPSTESPKRLFRINKLSNPAPLQMPAQPGAGPVVVKEGDSVKEIKADDYKTRVEEILKAIQPLIPEAVKQELSDPYQQALCCAEYYYNM